MKDRKAGKESYKGRQGKLQMRARKATIAGKESYQGGKEWNKAGKERHKGRQGMA